MSKGQKTLSFQPTKFREFRRLKWEYQKATNRATLSDSEYIMHCAGVVAKSLQIRKQQGDV